MKKILISIISAVLICAVAYMVIVTACWDLEICISKPADYSGSYHEPIIIVGGNFATSTAKKKASDFSKKNGDFFLNFYEEHKDDEYKIDTFVTIENGKTIVTYKGTIADNETGEISPYEEQLVFDYVFTRTVRK